MANLAKPGKLKHDEITRLIDIDSGEEFDHGQSVRNTFPQCDFFLRVDHAVVGPSEAKAIAQINERVRRFFDLIFRTVVITPLQKKRRCMQLHRQRVTRLAFLGRLGLL